MGTKPRLPSAACQDGKRTDISNCFRYVLWFRGISVLGTTAISSMELTEGSGEVRYMGEYLHRPEYDNSHNMVSILDKDKSRASRLGKGSYRFTTADKIKRAQGKNGGLF